MLRGPSEGSGRGVVPSQTKHANVFIPIEPGARIEALRLVTRPDEQKLEIPRFRPRRDTSQELATNPLVPKRRAGVAIGQVAPLITRPRRTRDRVHDTDGHLGRQRAVVSLCDPCLLYTSPSPR